jgi:predicted DNA-binding protein YlxM (UPF0122 family)
MIDNHSEKIQQSQSRRITSDDYCKIYELYFMKHQTLTAIAEAINFSRLTVKHCIETQRVILTSINPDLLIDERYPVHGRHYARYTKKIASAYNENQYNPRENTKKAQDFITEWWEKQQRESKSRRWMNSKKLYARYCSAYPNDLVSYKTFTRLMSKIIGDEFKMSRGRPAAKK